LTLNLPTMSVSCLGGYKSAVLWLYKEHNLPIENDMSNYLNEAIHGYRTVIATKKENGVMKLQEGRSPLTFTGYLSLAKMLLAYSPFGWVYFILTWNLMCRSNNTGKIHLSHCKLNMDCIAVTFARTKSDQGGESQNQNEKHIYANPLMPEICPMLALGVWLCTRSFNSAAHDTFRLFDGPKPHERFSKLFAQILKRVPENSELRGQIKDLGVHSERKGSSTYVLSLSTTISAIAVYLRAGWSIGNVQDRYIFSGSGSDQVVGRAVAGLPINSTDFGTLPPHFTLADHDAMRAVGWNLLIVGYDQLPNTFKDIVPMLIANIIFHVEWLRATLPENHPLFCSSVFTKSFDIGGRRQTIVQHFREKIVCGKMFDPVTRMQATGVPPHLTLLGAIAKLEDALLRLERHITDTCSVIPNQVKELILQNFQFEGTLPITRTDFENFRTEMTRVITDALLQHGPRRETETSGSTGGGNTIRQNNSGHEFDVYFWGGKAHLIPESFEWPHNITMRAMWLLYHFGDSGRRITAYRKIQRTSLRSKKEKTSFDRAKKSINALMEAATTLGLIQSSTQIISSDTLAEQIFLQAFPLLVSKTYGQKSPARPNEITYTTFASRLKAHVVSPSTTE
jgi:hypothetical protein